MMNDRVHACPLRRTQNGIRVALVHRDDNRRIGSDNFLQRDFTRTVLLMLAKPIFSDIFAAARSIQSWFSEGLPVVVSGLPIL